MRDMRITSILAYDHHVKAGKATSQRARIMDTIEKDGPATREELFNYFRKNPPEIPMGSVCGRVKALLQSDLLCVSGYAPSPYGKGKVEVLDLWERHNSSQGTK